MKNRVDLHTIRGTALIRFGVFLLAGDYQKPAYICRNITKDCVLRLGGGYDLASEYLLNYRIDKASSVLWYPRLSPLEQEECQGFSSKVVLEEKFRGYPDLSASSHTF